MITLPVKDDIYLAQLSREDIPGLVSAINDPQIASNTISIPYPYSLTDGLDFLRLCVERQRSAGYYTDWVIKREDEVVGGIGLLCQDGYQSHRSEFGYWVASAYRNKGIITGAIKTFVQFVFDKLHFVRLEAHTFCDNVASQKVLEKNGFLREGMLRKYVQKENALKDVYYFSRLHPSIST